MTSLCWMTWLAFLACEGNGTTGVGNLPVNLRFEPVASGLNSPVYVTAPANDDRLFIVEQVGRIRIVKNGQLLATPFLDIRSKVRHSGEQGLLSVAFHPAYATNGFFYVNYTDTSGTNGDTYVERYTVSANPDVANAASAKLILYVNQPYSNHNGGHVLFGPDGMLYIGMGDGGSGGDPQGHGQNRTTLLGDLLRIDVDGGDPYAIPPDNPFVGSTAGLRGEIWIWGLRNPWRFAFDATAGLLYVADVGQVQWEEITVAPAGDGGLNFGWRVMEGAHCYNASTCNMQGLVQPAVEYDHAGDQCSVTGGFVYRGTRIPELAGHYFYGDFCAGWIRSFRYADGRAVDLINWDLMVSNLSSFGMDATGELYVTSLGGTVQRIVRAS